MGSIIGPYVTVAHEMGHNFGFSHDTGMFSPKWEKWGGGGREKGGLGYFRLGREEAKLYDKEV